MVVGAALANKTRGDVVIAFESAEAAKQQFVFRLVDSNGTVLWSSDAALEDGDDVEAALRRGKVWRRVVRVPLVIEGVALEPGSYAVEAVVGADVIASATIAFNVVEASGEPQPPAGGGTQPPADGGTRPQPPTDGQQPPTSGGTQPPANGGTQPPSGGQQPPTDGQQPPTGGQQPPTGGQQPPPPRPGGQLPPPPGGKLPPPGGQLPPPPTGGTQPIRS
jgi:hypothetical protein